MNSSSSVGSFGAWPLAGRALVFGAGYLAAAELGFWLSLPGPFASFWPASGVALAVLMVAPTREWPILLLAFFSANLASNYFVHDQSFALSVGFSLANCVEPVLGASLMLRFVDRPILLDRVKCVALFCIFPVALSSMAGAAIGAGTVAVARGGLDGFGMNWYRWWTGDMEGMIVVAPILLLLMQWHRTNWFSGASLGDVPGRTLEALILGIAFVFMIAIIPDSWIGSPRILIYPLFIWAAVRFGPAAVATLMVVLAFSAVAQLRLGITPIEQAGFSTDQLVVQLQLYLSATAASFLMLAAAVLERKKQTDESMSDLLDAANDAVISIDERGTVLTFNKAGERMFGYAAADIVGQNVRTLMPEPHQSQHNGYLDNYLRTGQAKVIGSIQELTAMRKDGSIFPIDLAVSKFQTKSEHQFLGIVRDITLRKQAEATLEASNSRFYRLSDQAPVMMRRTGPDKLCVWFNKPWLTFRRRTIEQESGNGWTEGVHPDDYERCLATYVRAFDARRSFEMDYRLRRYDGEYRWILDKESPLIEGGKFLGYVGSCIDIHDRKRAENQRIEGDKQVRALILAIPDLILVIDAHGVIQDGYAQNTSEFAFLPPHYAGRTFSDAIAEPIAQLLMQGHQHVVQTREPWIGAFEAANEGVTNWFDVRMVASGSDEILAIIRNVTKEMVLEEQLLQSRKMDAIGRLAAGIAHDFNNILTAIFMGCEMALRSRVLDSDQRQTIEQILVDAQRAAALTQQVLAFGRGQTLLRKPLDLAQLVGNLVKMLRRVVREDITIDLQVALDSPFISADRHAIEQVITNLAVNARDAMPNGGTMTIRLESVAADSHTNRPGEFLCLSVADNGSGIPEAALSRIFEPFYSSKRIGQGSGLGLSVVEGIVHQHEGWINVKSQPGEGTVFRVFLPLVRPEAEDAASPKDSVLTTPDQNEVILLVEDDAAARDLVTRMLSELGHEVWQAENGPAALALWEKSNDRVTLLFSDIIMPHGISGVHLAERLCKSKPGLKVVLTSGYADEFKELDFPHTPHFRFLPKPFSVRSLSEAIRACQASADSKPVHLSG